MPHPIALTHRVALRPQARYLKFCQDYNTLSCCVPGHDLEDQVQFENLISGLGPGRKNPMMYPEVGYPACPLDLFSLHARLLRPGWRRVPQPSAAHTL